MKFTSLLHKLGAVPFLAMVTLQAFATTIPSQLSMGTSKLDKMVRQSDQARTSNEATLAPVVFNKPWLDLPQPQLIKFPPPWPPETATPAVSSLAERTDIDIRNANPFYPYALGSLVEHLYSVLLELGFKEYPGCVCGDCSQYLADDASDNCDALPPMPFFGEIALDTYFDDFAPGSAERDEENPTFIHLLAFFQVLEARLAALSSAADQTPVHQQILDYQSPMQRYLGLFSWAVEAKIMGSFVQSVEAIIDNQMNRLYDAVVAFIKLSPSTRKRDPNLYSEYLAIFIESQLMADMRTCWNSPGIRALSDDLVREADRTIVRHGIFRHKRKGFGASLAADKELKTQFRTTVYTNCLKVFHQQHYATLIKRADAVIQQYDKFLLEQQIRA